MQHSQCSYLSGSGICCNYCIIGKHCRLPWGHAFVGENS